MRRDAVMSLAQYILDIRRHQAANKQAVRSFLGPDLRIVENEMIS